MATLGTSAVSTPTAQALYRRRRRGNGILLSLSFGATIFGLTWLVLILVALLWQGFSGLSLSVFTEMTPPPQAETGGLANAIFGSLMMVSLATLIGTPVGIMAGIHLAEYGKGLHRYAGGKQEEGNQEERFHGLECPR